MRTDFVLPKWAPPDQERRPPLSDNAYLAWLSEERIWLISENRLEKLKADIARRPVDARFIL
jgi:hypothetical protein